MGDRAQKYALVQLETDDYYDTPNKGDIGIVEKDFPEHDGVYMVEWIKDPDRSVTTGPIYAQHLKLLGYFWVSMPDDMPTLITLMADAIKGSPFDSTPGDILHRDLQLILDSVRKVVEDPNRMLLNVPIDDAPAKLRALADRLERPPEKLTFERFRELA